MKRFDFDAHVVAIPVPRGLLVGVLVGLLGNIALNASNDVSNDDGRAMPLLVANIAEHRCGLRAEAIPLAEAAPVPPDMSELTPIALERRWLRGPFASPAEIDADLGYEVAAWQEFLYTHDAAARLAISTETYRREGVTPDSQFYADRFGGIWVMPLHTRVVHRAVHAAVEYTRDIYVLPTGQRFRGVLPVP